MGFRKEIGKPQTYRGSLITVEFIGPDVSPVVDGASLQSFFTDAPSARAAAKRYIDESIAAVAKMKKEPSNGN